MAKGSKILELCEWLDRNKVAYEKIDDETLEIPEFGKVYFQNTEKAIYNSIFKKDKEGNLKFNCMEFPEVLLQEGIEYAAFKFGDNFYYTPLSGDFSLNILKYVGKRVPPQRKERFANLGVHTPFELLNGSFMPDQWAKKAKYLGHEAIGICDRNTMAGCYPLQKECEAAGIKPVFGYSLTVDAGICKFGAKVYVQSQRGYRNLLRIQKAIMVDNPEEKTISLEGLASRGEGNVLVIEKLHSDAMEKPSVLNPLMESFQDVYYQVDLSEYKAERIDVKALEAAKKYFDEFYPDPSMPRPVLITDAYYLDKDDAKNKIILNKIADGAAHEQSDDQYFKDADEHYALFQSLFSERWDIDALFGECCANAAKIADGATARMDTSRNFMPKYDLTPEEKEKYGTAHNMFCQLLEDGLRRLAPKDRLEEYRKQMEYEKYIIESTDNVDYLLVQYDTCNWARRNDILVGCGRGSAAGSLLLYLLGITLIDPIKYNLIFERFLLPERAGLEPALTTVVGQDVESTEYVELELENGKRLRVDKDAQLVVRRGGESATVYADELEEGDDIVFDNRDEIFTINEIQQ